MKKGFTLIELLAVIIILAIIALIATPIVLDVVEDAKASAAKSEANLVLSSINNYCAIEAMKVQLGTVTAENKICADGAVDATNVAKMVSTTATVSATLTNGVVSALTVTSNGYTYTLSGNQMVSTTPAA